MPSPALSIVIPTFNRRAALPAAVDSALAWLDALGGGEIVVVDDASGDGTEAMVRERYADPMARGQLLFHRLPENGGVSAAKNKGAELARGEWLVFLDSDDLLKPEAVFPVVEQLERAAGAPLVWFRCSNRAEGRLLGAAETRPRPIDVRTLVGVWRWGECMPVARADACRRFPYPAALRGYEGIALARMIRELGDAILSPVVARIYDDRGTDRLTAPANLRRQSCLRARGAWALLTEFGAAMSVARRLRYLLSAGRAGAACWLSRRFGRDR